MPGARNRPASTAVSSAPVRLFQEGLHHWGEDRLIEAEAAFAEAVRLEPEMAEALVNLGLLHDRQGRPDAALAAFDRALAARPGLALAHFNRGNLLAKLGRPDEAMAAYERALAEDPRLVDAWINVGNLLARRHRLDEAVEACRTALRHRPESLPALVNLAHHHRARNEVEAALAVSARALDLDPDLAEAHVNQAVARLVSGDFARGWEQYEQRWRLRGSGQRPPQLRPQWSGAEPLAGQAILLYAEQGLGDTLQFLRYVPRVVATGARVHLEVPAPLRPLVADFPGTATVGTTGEPRPAVDWYCPLASLPRVFRTELPTIPAAVPYLQAPSRAAPRLPRRAGAGHRVGVAWCGHPGHPNDFNRSIPLATFRRLLESTPAAEFYGLQPNPRPGERAALADLPRFTDLAGQLADFAATAAVLADLDLVITVDTACAHLAGALGRPTWLLLPFAPDWRWLLGRADSPWYPTMRLFRQPRAGDWDSVLDEVAGALAARLAASPPPGDT